MIVFGTRFFGKVDVVPNLFHVATNFFHIYYLPLIPTGSMLVLGQSGNHVNGVKIPLSGKSILMAWGRVACVIAMIFFGLGAIVIAGDQETVLAVMFAALSATAILLLVMSYKWKRVSRASYERACGLAQSAGFNAEGMEIIRRAFAMSEQYSPIHGFPVVSPAPAAMTPPPLPQRPAVPEQQFAPILPLQPTLHEQVKQEPTAADSDRIGL